MQEISPQSPERREARRALGRVEHELRKLGPGTRIFEVSKRVAVGVYSDGFIHAGNLAYLTLVTLFPFFIVLAALASAFGRSADAQAAVAGFFVTLPANVQDVVRKPIEDVLSARTGNLLWLGALVGFWTVGSFIETIRDILRRAYGTTASSPFWHYRLFSIGLTMAAVLLVMASFSAQIMLAGAEQFVRGVAPWVGRAGDIAGRIGLFRLIPLVSLWVAMYLVFWSLMPSKYRYARVPKWPGVTFVVLWWFMMVSITPYLFTRLSNYSLTYGGLAGVIIALIFFWFIGLGIVVGAHLNAALAEPHEAGLKAAEIDTAGAAGLAGENAA